MPEARNTHDSLKKAIEQVYDLNVGIVGQGLERHERPHKPLLLLAILDLVEAGDLDPTAILWNPRLREQFGRYFNVVRLRDDKNTPENPFLYLRSEGFWTPYVRDDGGNLHQLSATPSVADARSGRVYAQFSPEWVGMLRQPSARRELREAIIARYFSKYRQKLSGLLPVEPLPEETLRVAEEEDTEPGYGRSPAFRRRILEIYDYQCAACGLRIKLPPADLTFVDAAHLIPFSESRNDHPTNGLALCKNHHWAMDRHIIAPSPDLRWEVSRSLDARRSPGEKELLSLHGQRVLIPAEEAFRPDTEALAWRMARLIA